MNLLVYAKPVIQYANAIVLTIKEMAKALAQTKQETDEIDYETEFAGFGNSVEDTTEAVDELSKALSLLALDKLNILGSSGTTIADGLSVEGNILDALKEYKMNLDKVSYRAKEISERMMTWLGYSKQLNNETGEFDWKLGSGNTNLKKIETSLLAVSGIFVGAKMAEGLGSFVGSFDTVSKLLAGKGGILATIGIIGAVIGGLYATNEDFRASVNELGKELIKGIKPIVEDVSKLVKIIFDYIGEVALSLMPIISEIIKTISDVINDLNPIIEAIIDIIDIVLKNSLKQIKLQFKAIGKVVEIIGPIIEDIADFIGKTIGPIIEDIADYIEKISDQFEKYILPYIEEASKLFEALSGVISALLSPEGAMTLLGIAIEGIKSSVGSIGTIFEQSFKAGLALLKGDFDTFKEEMIKLKDELKSIWKDFWDYMDEKMKSLTEKIMEGILGDEYDRYKEWKDKQDGMAGLPLGPKSRKRASTLAREGVITTPTIELTGEYQNSNSNSLVVAPQSIMKETFLEAVTPLINAVLQGDNNLLKALNDKDTNVYLNGRKVSEAIYDDLGAVATRKGKVIFASNT